MFRITTSLFLALSWLAGCSAPLRSGTNPAILAQWSGLHSGVEQPSSRVIRDAAEWTALWRQLNREAPQSLDKNQMAVAIFLGQRRSGGFRVEVTGAGAEAGEIVLEYREHTPAPGMMTTQALTSPWAVVTLPASPHNVVVRPLPTVPPTDK
jgi:hypothetical protein